VLGSPRDDPGIELRKFPQNSALFFAAVAAIVLVLAQLGAMNHAYSHVPQVAATVQDANPAAHAVCDECLSFAPMLSSAGSPSFATFVAPPARAIALAAVAAALLNHRLDLAFRSRAPPVSA
jgi:hypothetical protein